MKFNFPEATRREKFINLGLTGDLYSKIKNIADTRNITLVDVIRTFLIASLEEYKSQFGDLRTKEEKTKSINKKEEDKVENPKFFKSKIPENKLPTTLANNCIKCGMSLVGQFSDRRSKKSLSLCDSCSGDFKEDDESGIYKSPSLI